MKYNNDLFVFPDTQENLSQKELKTIHKNLHNLLDKVGVYLSIVDLDTFEILFVNDRIKKDLGADLTGRKCWEALQKNQTGPCDFCTKDKLIDENGNAAGPHVREYYNERFKRWFEAHEQVISWGENRLVRLGISIDITDYKKKIEFLDNKVNRLSAELEEINTAFKVLIDKIDEEKLDLEKNILQNYESIVLPLIEKLKNRVENTKEEHFLRILETNLEEITSPFSRNLSDKTRKLSPKEIQIAAMIKQGLSTKEIAHALNLSIRTIGTHRDNIRRKLSLKGKKINLQSYLSSL